LLKNNQLEAGTVFTVSAIFTIMDDYIEISLLNDFIFCPLSIYYHRLYDDSDKLLYQGKEQINGTKAHGTVDNSTYSNKKDILQGIYVCSNKYHLIGKIDIFQIDTGKLIERKKQIKTIYDGYIFQIYAQYFCLEEMGYEVKELVLYSIDDNKSYCIPNPHDEQDMFLKFLDILNQIRAYELSSFIPNNIKKCATCIYEPLCDRSLL